MSFRPLDETYARKGIETFFPNVLLRKSEMRLTPGRALKRTQDKEATVMLLDETYARKGIETLLGILMKCTSRDETYARKGIETATIPFFLRTIADETYARKGIETNPQSLFLLLY